MNKLITIIILVFSVTLSAQSKFGTTAANFLTIPVGSRASGMGGEIGRASCRERV